MTKVRSPWKYSALPLAVVSLGGLLTWAQASSSSPTKQASSPSAQHAVAGGTNPGERAFQANCVRCHNPPEQLSPRIAGTVLRHMRERALLSPQEERDILKYLAP
jgi:mono/diheme cytochrome c family protein